MHNKIKFIISLLALTMMAAAQAYPVKAKIDFVNETDQKIEMTKTPHLENYESFYKNNDDYQFTSPSNLIEPHQTTTTSLSYDWYNDGWYGGSQFAYNYAGRPKEYGCFVTELRFSGAHAWNEWGYNVVIASYLQDPSNPNDYLMCTVEQDPKDRIHFIVHLQSSAQDKQTDDSKRFVIVGDTNYLGSSYSWGITLPIELNKKLFLYPNHEEPETTIPPARTVPSTAKHIKIINHTNETLVAGTPVLDRERQFNSDYYVDQPQEIAPNTKQSIVYDAWSSPLPMQRFNYHIKGYSEDSGCFISTATDFGRNYAAFHFDPNHPLPEKNLYCVIKGSTVDIYDNFDDALPRFQGCSLTTVFHHIEDCVSYSDNGYYGFQKKFEPYDTCGMGFSFYLDPVHKIELNHVTCHSGILLAT